jgi:hypothetical protein
MPPFKRAARPTQEYEVLGDVRLAMLLHAAATTVRPPCSARYGRPRTSRTSPPCRGPAAA